MIFGGIAVDARAPRGRILIVEDEPDMRETLRKALERQGYRVGVAADGAEALRILGEEPFDLVLTDLRLPRMSGLAFLEELGAVRPGVPVIVVTGFGTRENWRRATALRVRGFLTKPLRLVELMTTVERALATDHRAEGQA